LIKILPIGSLVDKYLQSEGIVEVDGLEVPSFDENGKISFKSVKYLIKHKSNGKMLEITTKTGRRVKVSKGHSLFMLKDYSIKTIPSDRLVAGDYIIIPKQLPINPSIENVEIVKIDELNLNEYKLMILGDKIEKFMKKRISYPPFALPIKEIGLDKICDLIKDSKLRKLARDYVHNLEKGRKHIGIDVMEKIIEKIDKEKANEEEKKIINLIEKFVKGDIAVDIIESIKEVEGSEFEYDISVEKNENFVGGIGGIMLHNSGHSDRNQLIAFIHKLSSKPDRVIVAHGESQKSLEIARMIHKIFRVETNVPRNLESLRLK
jgi:intein/homing endonuclease